MAADFVTMLDKAMTSLEHIKGEDATHTAASTGTATAITILFYPLIFTTTDPEQNANMIVRPGALTYKPNDTITYDGAIWFIRDVKEEDGVVKLAVAAMEVRQ